MMERTNRLFRNMQDTVFITDAYGYLLDFNHAEHFKTVKKGVKLKKIIQECFEGNTGVVRADGRVFSRATSPIMRGDELCGYTVLLSDVTAEASITEQRRQTRRDLDLLINETESSNAALESYAVQVKALTDYAEQLRIAQVIHDDAGHAITELHAISEMCLKLKDSDPERYRALIEEGKNICASALSATKDRDFNSLEDLLKNFAHMSRIKVEQALAGDEPAFLKQHYKLIGRVLKEAYHNTLDHSFADTIMISAEMSEDEVSLTVSDNGVFHGEFEKGFGLGTVEENVLRSGGEISFIAQNGKGFEIRLKWRKEI